MAMTLDQRKEFVMSHGLCFGCLIQGHISNMTLNHMIIQRQSQSALQ